MSRWNRTFSHTICAVLIALTKLPNTMPVDGCPARLLVSAISLSRRILARWTVVGYEHLLEYNLPNLI